MKKSFTEKLFDKVCSSRVSSLDSSNLTTFLKNVVFLLVDSYNNKASPSNSITGKCVHYLRLASEEALSCCANPLPITLFPSYYQSNFGTTDGFQNQEFVLTGEGLSSTTVTARYDLSAFPVPVRDSGGSIGFLQFDGRWNDFSPGAPYDPIIEIVNGVLAIDIISQSNGEVRFQIQEPFEYSAFPDSAEVTNIVIEIDGVDYQVYSTSDNTDFLPDCQPDDGFGDFPEIFSPNEPVEGATFGSDIQYSPLSTFDGTGLFQGNTSIPDTGIEQRFLAHNYLPDGSGVHDDIDKYWIQARRHNFNPNECDGVIADNIFVRDSFLGNDTKQIDHAIGLFSTGTESNVSDKLLIALEIEDSVITGVRTQAGTQLFSTPIPDGLDDFGNLVRFINNSDGTITIQYFATIFSNFVRDDPAFIIFDETFAVDTSQFDSVASTVYAKSFGHLAKIKDSLYITRFDLNYA